MKKILVLIDGIGDLACDVFKGEPEGKAGEVSSKLMNNPNIYVTHHIGASTEQAHDAVAEETINIIKHFAHSVFLRINHSSLYTCLPPIITSFTLIFLICSGAIFRGFWSRIVKSASFPTSIVPLISSSKVCQAASMVTARSASSGVS